jgi:hypothetical protein
LSARPQPGSIEIQFESIREGWSVYRVEQDDATIKVKLVLMKLFLEAIDESGNPRFSAGTNVSLIASVPSRLRGTPSTQQYPPREIAESVVAEDLTFDTIKEEWNEYRLLPDGAMIGIKPVLTMISRTNKYDGNGDPIYHVQQQALFRGKTSKEVKEKFRQMLHPQPS